MTDTTTSDRKDSDVSNRGLVAIPDATNLSWLAETADGSRGVDLYLIQDNEGKLQLVRETELKGRAWLVTVKTPKKRPHRGIVNEVTCGGTYHGENFMLDPLSDRDYYDALFWTESSVEKFLYPYYRAHRIWDDKIDKVKRKFDRHDTAVAIAHRAPSTSEALSYETMRIGVAGTRGLVPGWMTVDEFLAYEPEPS
jgi:hypothetical protein